MCVRVIYVGIICLSERAGGGNVRSLQSGELFSAQVWHVYSKSYTPKTCLMDSFLTNNCTLYRGVKRNIGTFFSLLEERKLCECDFWRFPVENETNMSIRMRISFSRFISNVIRFAWWAFLSFPSKATDINVYAAL